MSPPQGADYLGKTGIYRKTGKMFATTTSQKNLKLPSIALAEIDERRLAGTEFHFYGRCPIICAAAPFAEQMRQYRAGRSAPDLAGERGQAAVGADDAAPQIDDDIEAPDCPGRRFLQSDFAQSVAQRHA